MGEDCIRFAAEAIADADAILVTAGAGMGVDSGLPDFRSEEGFWNAYPALKHLELRFEDMAVPDWFLERPAMAWAFYGHRQALYRDTEPHAGYGILKSWCEEMAQGYCVYTSNVDGHFQKAGFPHERVVECHGNIHVHQCSEPCTEEYWLGEAQDLRINLDEMRIICDPPRCPACHRVARPNLLMFMDSRWLSARKRRMVECMEQWLKTAPFSKLAIIECGAGSAVSTVRRRGELIAADFNGTLIRINPGEPEGPEDAISVPLPALDALTRIDAQLQKIKRRRSAVGFVQRLTGGEAKRAERPDPELDYPEPDPCFTVQRVPTLRDLKFWRVYGRPWTLRIDDERVGWVADFSVTRTYAGMIEGLPDRSRLLTLTDWARKWGIKAIGGNPQSKHRPMVIFPKVFDQDSYNPILPPLLCAARVCCHRPVGTLEEPSNSELTLVFFADRDEQGSVVEMVGKVMKKISWQHAAQDYGI